MGCPGCSSPYAPRWLLDSALRLRPSSLAAAQTPKRLCLSPLSGHKGRRLSRAALRARQPLVAGARGEARRAGNSAGAALNGTPLPRCPDRRGTRCGAHLVQGRINRRRTGPRGHPRVQTRRGARLRPTGEGGQHTPRLLRRCPRPVRLARKATSPRCPAPATTSPFSSPANGATASAHLWSCGAPPSATGTTLPALRQPRSPVLPRLWPVFDVVWPAQANAGARKDGDGAGAASASRADWR